MENEAALIYCWMTRIRNTEVTSTYVSNPQPSRTSTFNYTLVLAVELTCLVRPHQPPGQIFVSAELCSVETLSSYSPTVSTDY